jgi:type VI secretion system secreted protein Hcp
VCRVWRKRKKEEGIMFKDKRTAMVGTLVLVLFLLSLILTNPGKLLAVDAFLKIDGVKGESADAKHKDEIDVISWSFGETNSGTAHTGGGAGAGKVKFQDFKFTMRTNIASPQLFQYCANGKHINKVTLFVRRSDQTQAEFLQIWLSDVMVSSFLNMGSAGPNIPYPVDEILLNFSSIKIDYKQVKQDGSLGGSVSGGWNLKANKAE